MSRPNISEDFEFDEYDERNRLIRIIHKTIYDYYIGDGVAGVITFILIGVLVFAFIKAAEIPLWGSVVLIIGLFGLIEAKRQHGRLNALFELYELDKDKANKPEMATPRNPSD